MDAAALRSTALRVAALALLLLLVLVATLTVRTLSRVPDATLYLVRSRPTTFTLEPVHRRLGARGPEAFARAAVAALAAGPTEAEASAGLNSAVPAGTRVTDARFDDARLVVELSPEFVEGGGSAAMFGRLHQLRWTLTGPSAIDEVSLRMDGAPLEVLGGEGLLVEPTWSRPPSGALPAW